MFALHGKNVPTETPRDAPSSLLIGRRLFQVDVHSSCVFLPARPLRLRDPTANIPHNLQRLYRAGAEAVALPPTLVVAFPCVTLHSAAHKHVDVDQSVPIKALEHSVLGEAQENRKSPFETVVGALVDRAAPWSTFV